MYDEFLIGIFKFRFHKHRYLLIKSKHLDSRQATDLKNIIEHNYIIIRLKKYFIIIILIGKYYRFTISLTCKRKISCSREKLKYHFHMMGSHIFELILVENYFMTRVCTPGVLLFI